MEYLQNFKTNLARVVIANEKATDKMASGLLYEKKNYDILNKKDVCLQKLVWVKPFKLYFMYFGIFFFIWCFWHLS